MGPYESKSPLAVLRLSQRGTSGILYFYHYVTTTSTNSTTCTRASSADADQPQIGTPYSPFTTTTHFCKMQVQGAADDSAWRPSWKARVSDTVEIESYRKATLKGAFSLTPSEIWWRDHAMFLESQGYRLRPRFRPGWTPSWTVANLNPFLCEDGRHLPVFPFSNNFSHNHSYPTRRP